MKNKRTLVYIVGAAIVAAALCFIFLGNGTSSNSKAVSTPEEVIEQFISAMKEGDFDKAEKLCTSDTMSTYMTTFKKAWDKFSQEEAEVFAEITEILGETKVSLNGTQNLDGVSLVDYTLELNGMQKKHQATLRMEEGEWKVVKITDKN